MVKIVNHEERRHAIAKATVLVISEVGLEQAKLRVIAAKAGLTTGAVAHYFKDKDAVLEAALLEVGACLFSTSLENKEDKRPPNIMDILPTNDLNRMYWKVWLAFCGNASHSEKLRSIYKKFYADIEVSVANNLKLKDKKRAREIAASIIAAVDGVGLCATVQPDLWPPARQKARLSELLQVFFPSKI